MKTYNKRICMLLFAALMVLGVSAQDDRNCRVRIAMNELSYTPKEQKSNAKSVISKIAEVLVFNENTQHQDNYTDAARSAIVRGMTNARRVNAVDGDDGNPVDYYIDATLNNLSTTTKVEEKEVNKKKVKVTYYKAHASLTMHIKNATTNEVVYSPSFSISDYDSSWTESTDGCITSALNTISGRITRALDAWLPFQANIIESARQKKDKQKEVYIDLGSREGAYKDIHFNVYKVKTVAGKEAKQRIGRLRITEVQGEDISLCKVQSGGKEIKEAVDGGEQLLIVSTD